MYLLSYQTSRTTVQFEDNLAPGNFQRQHVISALDTHPLDKTTAEAAMDKAMNGPTTTALKAFCHRLMLQERIRMLMNILGALVILILVILSGWQFMTGKTPISHLVLYLLVFRYFLSSFRQAAGAINMSSRMYPPIRRYYDFLHTTPEPSGGIELDDTTLQERVTTLVDNLELPSRQSGLASEEAQAME